MNIFVGIDPSINSTGVCILETDDNNKCVNCKFYIVKSGKLTKKESKAEDDNIKIFQYVLYDKLDTSIKNIEDYKTLELNKTQNMINVCKCVKDIINKHVSNYKGVFNLYICQEGISYGSTIKTKSVFDLAGLNYLLRSTFINSDICNYFVIAAPSEIKKFATGKGNANKEMIVNMFSCIFPNLHLPKIDDICDAYFMANYASKLFEQGEI